MSRKSLRYSILILCLAALVFGVFQQAGAQPAEALQQAEILRNTQAGSPSQAGIWFGLVASLAGTLVFWLSVLFLARRRVR